MENKGGYELPPTAERLLRLMVANQKPATKYPIDLSVVLKLVEISSLRPD
jgi:hypothetical protein